MRAEWHFPFFGGFALTFLRTLISTILNFHFCANVFLNFISADLICADCRLY